MAVFGRICELNGFVWLSETMHNWKEQLGSCLVWASKFLLLCLLCEFDVQCNAMQCMRMLIGSCPAIRNFGCPPSTKLSSNFVLVSR